MAIKIITPPPVEPVDLETIKSHLRVVHDEEDSLISSYLKAARQYAEATLAWRAFVEQELELIMDRFPADTVKLPRPPLISVEHVKYWDSDNEERTLTEGDDYLVDDESEPGRVMTADRWPNDLYTINAVRIRYKAGYPPEGEGEEKDYTANIPEEIKQAILLLTAHFYEMREPVVIGQTVASVPMAVDALLAPYRAWGSDVE